MSLSAGEGQSFNGAFGMTERAVIFKVFSVVAALIVWAAPAYSDQESFETLDTARFILYVQRDRSPLEHTNLSTEQLTTHVLEVLDDTYEELKQKFQTAPTRKVVLRFISPRDFRRSTGAPEWTSAMFYRGEITIPFSEKKMLNMEELTLSLRHEYVHAVIAELSGSRAPAWLDEGVAQIIEGPANPIFGSALRRHISRKDALPLRSLHQGFTKLEKELVPVAYAQSLFVAKYLEKRFGWEALMNYFAYLKSRLSYPLAFELAFGKSIEDFEVELNRELRVWARSDAEEPAPV